MAPRFDPQKYKTVLKVLPMQIGQEMKMEDSKDQRMKMEISQQIHANKLDAAKLKAGEIVRIRNRGAVMDILKVYAEQIGYDLPLMQRALPNLPEALVPQLQALVFASTYYGMKYLAEFADMLKETYGKQFMEQAVDPNNCRADVELKNKIMFHTPSQMQIDEIIEEVRQFDEQRKQLVSNYDKLRNEGQPPNIPGPPGQGGEAPGPAGPKDDLDELRRRLAGL